MSHITTYLFARSLPQRIMFSTWSGIHVSRSTDLTRRKVSVTPSSSSPIQQEDSPLLIWVPIERWTPEHRIQTKTPIFQDAHRGSVDVKTKVSFPLAGGIPWFCSSSYLFSCNRHNTCWQAFSRDPWESWNASRSTPYQLSERIWSTWQQERKSERKEPTQLEREREINLSLVVYQRCSTFLQLNSYYYY